MLEIFTIILTLILISKYIEVRTKISFVLIILPLAFFVNYFFDLSILKNNFQEILFLMLPIMLIPDILGLSNDELEKNELNIFFLAVVAVALSILMAVGFTYSIDYFHNMSWGYLLLLFTPLMATDVVVSVDAIFAKFSLYRKMPISWANILTLAGMKGGLALIMIISLSDNFIYKEMFLAIILGVIILFIFTYTFSLMGYLYFKKDFIK